MRLTDGIWNDEKLIMFWLVIHISNLVRKGRNLILIFFIQTPNVSQSKIITTIEYIFITFMVVEIILKYRSEPEAQYFRLTLQSVIIHPWTVRKDAARKFSRGYSLVIEIIFIQLPTW